MEKPYSESDHEDFYDREWEEDNYPRAAYRVPAHPYYRNDDEMLDDPRRGQGTTK